MTKCTKNVEGSMAPGPPWIRLCIKDHLCGNEFFIEKAACPVRTSPSVKKDQCQFHNCCKQYMVLCKSQNEKHFLVSWARMMTIWRRTSATVCDGRKVSLQWDGIVIQSSKMFKHILFGNKFQSKNHCTENLLQRLSVLLQT